MRLVRVVRELRRENDRMRDDFERERDALRRRYEGTGSGRGQGNMTSEGRARRSSIRQ